MTLSALLDSEFTTPPYLHQLKEFENHSDDRARAWAWTMRTGKSKEAIDKVCRWYCRLHKADAVLIFAPNGVHANWIEVEFPKHVWEEVRYDALVWRSSELSKKKRDKLGRVARETFEFDRKAWFDRLKRAKHSPNLMILSVNSESMIRPDARRAIKFLLKNRRVFGVFDESDDFGIPGAQRTKMAIALSRRCVASVIMSGTMTTGSPLAAWSQYELLKPGALGFEKYTDFKNHFGEFEMDYKGGHHFPKLVGFKNLDELRERMAPFTSVVLREDCKDMPAVVQEVRRVEPTEEQLRVYRRLHHSIMVEIRNEPISIGELAPKLQKLQQVFSGFLIDEFKTLHRIPGPNPRLDLLRRETYLAPGKVVVWCQFQEDIDNAMTALSLEGFECVEYHGRIDDAEKKESLRRFREDRKVKALIGQSQSGGRGLDMSVASRIFWYSHTFKARLRQQAKERATAIGGGNILMLDFIAPGPDEYILKTTDGRVQLGEYLSGAGMKTLLGSLEL